MVIAVVLATTAALAPSALAGSGSGSAINARVVGTFKLHAYVTTAVNVRGEHAGQKFIRIWKIIPKECDRSICKVLSLRRQISDHRHDHITLDRVGPGMYRGQGVFYAPLECLGKTYPRGSRIPYTITLTVHHAVTIQGIRFAHSLRATYNNPYRTDETPCPLGSSHDAGRYWGHVESPPAPPVAAFSAAVNPKTRTAVFTDTSHRTANGRQIVSYLWKFGDPGSGHANRSSQASPTHQFSAPGVYEVRLTVVDRNGLSATAKRTVTVPGPPTAAFTDAQTSTPGTFAFTDQSSEGGAAIVHWHWNFGDPGSGARDTSSSQNPSHRYSSTGTYSVTLTVTDANGLKSSVEHKVTY
jgi:PKD repeat protein